MIKKRNFLAILLVVAMVLSLVPAMAFGADDGPVLAGKNRYETAALIAGEAYPAGTDAVVIANGEEALDYADALAGSYLAGAADAAILLTRAGSLHKATEEAIKELGATKAYVLGGTAAVSEAVLEALEDLELKVERVAGKDRFETAAAIMKKGVELGADADAALIANGYSPADALAAGAYAHANGVPVLLVKKNSVPAATAEALEGVAKVTVVGGTAAVNAAVLEELDAKRVSGANRYATSVAVAEDLWDSPAGFALVEGHDGVVDALAGSVLGVPVLYVKAASIPAAVDEYLDDAVAGATWYVLGGQVGKKVVSAVEEKLEEPEIKVEEVTLANDSFYVGKADAANLPTVTIDAKDKFENEIDLEDEEVVVKLNGEKLHEGLEYTVGENTITLEKDYANVLKVGKYKLDITVSGTKIETQTITVKPLEAGINIWLAEDVILPDDELEIEVAAYTKEGELDDEFDLETLNGEGKVEVKIDGRKVVSQSLVVDSEGGKGTITVSAAYVEEILEIGKHKVQVKIDKTTKTLNFEVSDAKKLAVEIAPEEVTSGEAKEVELTLNLEDAKGTGIEAVNFGDADNLKKVTIKVDGKTLRGHEYTGETEGVVKLKEAYIATLAVGEHKISVTYNSIKAKDVKLTIKPGEAHADKSKITVAEELVAGEIYKIEIELKDANGVALPGKEVTVTADALAMLSKNKNMPSGVATVSGTPGLEVKTDKDGKAVLYIKYEKLGELEDDTIVVTGVSGLEAEVDLKAAEFSKAKDEEPKSETKNVIAFTAMDKFDNVIKDFKLKKSEVVVKYKDAVVTVDKVEVDKNTGVVTITLKAGQVEDKEVQVTVKGVDLGKVTVAKGMEMTVEVPDYTASAETTFTEEEEDVPEFGITTIAHGDAGTMVKGVGKLTVVPEDGKMALQYQEQQEGHPQKDQWLPADGIVLEKDDTFTFGPAGGFPLIDTGDEPSLFRAKFSKAGTYKGVIEIRTVVGNKLLYSLDIVFEVTEE